MRKNHVSNGIVLAMATVMGMSLMTGCGSKTADTAQIPLEEIALAEVPAEDAAPAIVETNVESKEQTQYFTKGVYANYAVGAENSEKTYFYVFDDDGTGHIEDGANNTGTFFEYVQADGHVNFYFGSNDPLEDVLTIKSFENGVVTGAYENCLDLVFEPLTDADPDTFDAVNYVNAARGEDFTYTDGNGWRVRYNPEVITVNPGGPVTTFVYTGDCAGTCMVTASYDIGMDAKKAAEELAKSWGDAKVTETTFPGTENVKGYYVYLTPAEGGIGLNESAFLRDYMDGYLQFEFTVHNSGDDAIDIPVSDALATIADTIEFPYEN